MILPEQARPLGDDLSEAPPAPRHNDRHEAAALAEVLQVLKHHPWVVWIAPQNSGVTRGSHGGSPGRDAGRRAVYGS